MKVQVAEIDPYGAPIVVAIVDSLYVNEHQGKHLLGRLQPYFPINSIMLVSIERNGFKAYATFETHRLLALIQLEHLSLREVDLTAPPPERDDPLPF